MVLLELMRQVNDFINTVGNEEIQNREELYKKYTLYQPKAQMPKMVFNYLLNIYNSKS